MYEPKINLPTEKSLLGLFYKSGISMGIMRKTKQK
jgi:hypothetical protein